MSQPANISTVNFAPAPATPATDSLPAPIRVHPTADAAKISPSGSPIGTSMPNWMRPPHFYRKDNLILIYLGDNPRVRSALEAQAGPQIAGAR